VRDCESQEREAAMQIELAVDVDSVRLDRATTDEETER
jgi:hypothetical protein